MKYSIVPVLTIFVAVSAFGEPPVAEPSPAPAATVGAAPTPAKLPPYLDLLELKIEVADRNYTTAQNDDTLSQYIEAAQEYLAAACFSTLRSTLQYRGFPEDDRCRELIKKVLALDANNSIALCSQNGIDSRECRETAASVVNGSFDVDTGSWYLDDQSKAGNLPAIDLKTALDQKSQNKQILDQTRELDKLADLLHSRATDLTLRDKYQTLLERSLTEACVDIKYLVYPLTDSNAAPGSPAEMVPSTAKSSMSAPAPNQPDPFAQLLNTMNSGLPTPAPTLAPLTFPGPNHLHYRLLPKNCSDILKNAPPFMNALPVIVCNRDGAVSPSCITSRHNAASRPATVHSSQNGGSSSGEAFSKF